LVRGSTNIFAAGGEFVVHPPLGKVAIAGGEWLFGLTPFGWRFAVAVIGSLSILMTARIARRMTRSTLLGCVAGLLLALDGLEFVLSRTAILDIFVMFWALAAFGLLIIDRDRTRARLAAAGAAGTGGAAGPKLGIRWARVLAGVCLGCACASKWNGIWFLPAFAGLALAWDFGARRAAGFASPGYGVLRSEAKWFPVWFGLLPLATYLASWSGWFATSDGYDRNWAAQHGNHVPIWSALDSLYQYDREMMQFGLGLTATQTYKSQPWTWLMLGRPVSFFYATPHTCGAASCSQEVLAIGTGAYLLPGLVADPPGLAGRGSADRSCGGLAALVLVRLARSPDDVLLLRRGVRAVPDHRHHAVPRPDHPASRGGHGPARDRSGGRGRLPACRTGKLRLPVSPARRPGDPVQFLVRPDVVPQLDLAAGPAGDSASGRRIIPISLRDQNCYPDHAS